MKRRSAWSHLLQLGFTINLELPINWKRSTLAAWDNPSILRSQLSLGSLLFIAIFLSFSKDDFISTLISLFTMLYATNPRKRKSQSLVKHESTLTPIYMHNFKWSSYLRAPCLRGYSYSYQPWPDAQVFFSSKKFVHHDQSLVFYIHGLITYSLRKHKFILIS